MRTLAEPIENYIPMDRRKRKGTLNDAIHSVDPQAFGMASMQRDVGRPPVFQESPSAMDMREMNLQSQQSGYGLQGQMGGQGQTQMGRDPRMGVIQANIQGHIIPPEGSNRAGFSQAPRHPSMAIGQSGMGPQGLDVPAPPDPQGLTSQLEDARKEAYLNGGKRMSSMIREGLLAGMRGM